MTYYEKFLFFMPWMAIAALVVGAFRSNGRIDDLVRRVEALEAQR